MYERKPINGSRAHPWHLLAPVVEDILTEIEEERVRVLTPEQIDAELRTLGMRADSFSPDYVLARALARTNNVHEARSAGLLVTQHGEYVLPGSKLVERWLRIEAEVAQEQAAILATLTRQEIVERLEALGFDTAKVSLDELQMRAKRRAGPPKVEGEADGIADWGDEVPQAAEKDDA